MASTMIAKATGEPSQAAPDLETARQINDNLRHLIQQAMDPRSSRPTPLWLREFTLWVQRRAEEDGIVLSEEDYVDLIDAVARVELGSRVGSWISELIDLRGGEREWSGGMATLRQYTFVKHE